MGKEWSEEILLVRSKVHRLVLRTYVRSMPNTHIAGFASHEHSTVQFCAPQYSTVQCNTGQYSVTQCITAQHDAVQCNIGNLSEYMFIREVPNRAENGANDFTF
jgi:hypothetical protein